MELVPSSGWFAVRCLFRCGWPPLASGDDSSRYEERITLWQAGDIDEAIVKAETEAQAYAAAIEEAPSEYLGLAQAYALVDVPNLEGAEIFSLIGDSRLDSNCYLDAFFDTGAGTPAHRRGPARLKRDAQRSAYRHSAAPQSGRLTGRGDG